MQTQSPTDPVAQPLRRVRSALFVDFDNVYLGLRDLDAGLAERFATDPANWISNLKTGSDEDGRFARRFLVLNCYLNPSNFARYRAFWTRAGFRVVDCPSLTQQGKSSADINLVLDAIDALGHSTRYEEFMIASADADFTSLVYRCRAADRLVTVITAGPVAGAYRSVADTVIQADLLTDQPPAPPLPVDPPARSLGTEPAPSSESAQANAASGPATGAQVAAQPRAADAVRRAVREAPGPITGASAAHAARSVDAELSNGWGGHQSFGAWLAAEVPDVGYSSKPSPGYCWDPTRFSEADLPGEQEVHLSDLQRQVVRVTGVPALSPAGYAAVLDALAADLATYPFDRTDTSKRVRDACQGSDESIGRGAINFVIQGLLYSGVTLSGALSASELADSWSNNVEGLCRGARMEFDAAQLAELRNWVGGGLAKR